MSQRINVNLYPKDGYFFKEQDKTIIRAGNWKDVIKKVVAYRERARLPLGEPEREVIAQACSRNPSHCFDKVVVTARPPVTLKSKVLQWLNAMLKVKAELTYVTPQEAAVRAQVCAGCPMNQSLGVSSCNSCKQAFGEFRKQLLGGSRVRDARLGGCAILNSDLMTATHLDEIRVDNKALPAHCWRKVSA